MPSFVAKVRALKHGEKAKPLNVRWLRESHPLLEPAAVDPQAGTHCQPFYLYCKGVELFDTWSIDVRRMLLTSVDPLDGPQLLQC